MPREKILHAERYRSGGIVLRPAFLPVLRHQANNGETFVAAAAEVIGAGKIQGQDGRIREYQDLRIWLADPPTQPTPAGATEPTNQ